jgi:hypothetical protein
MSNGWRWLWERRQRTVARAECPGCAGSVVTRMLHAWHVGGNGLQVEADAAGEVVRCCACGAVFTVLASGAVLRAQGGRPAPAAAAQVPSRGARDRQGWGLDRDLETLTTDEPPL